MKILACIADDGAARSVLDTARTLGHMLGMMVEAYHVRETGAGEVEGIAQDVGVTLRVERGDPVPSIVRALSQADVEMGILGARRLGGPEPTGHIALAVIAGASKPIVVIPPNAAETGPGELKRLLLPLNGTPDAASAVIATEHVFSGSGVEVVALHVFDPRHTPSFLDHPEHDLDVWAEEFLARHGGDQSARLEIRRGETGERVLDVAGSERVDMIALAWSQDLSPGRSGVIRRVLAGAAIPVLLVPVVHADVSPKERVGVEAT